MDPPLSDPLTYSATISRGEAMQVLADAKVTVVIAGDAVPSVHLQARNGSVEEIARAMACMRGQRVLLGPSPPGSCATHPAMPGLFDTVHTHTITSADLARGKQGGRALRAAGCRPRARTRD